VSKTKNGDPNVQAAIEASEKFIREHPEVPIVDVPRVGEGVTPPQVDLLAAAKRMEDMRKVGAAMFGEVTPPSPEPPTANYVQLLPGGICFAHGPYQHGYQCSRWPACDTDPKKQEYIDMSRVSQGQAQTPKPATASQQLDRIFDAIGESIAEMSGEEILAEATPEELKSAAQLKAGMLKTVEDFKARQVEGQAQTPTRPACTCNLFRGEHFSWCRPEERILTGVCAYCGAPYVHAQVEGQAEPPSQPESLYDFLCDAMNELSYRQDLGVPSPGWNATAAKINAALNAGRLSPTAAIDPEVLDALKCARGFIKNGVEFGYIRMPDADLRDSAHDTLPKIEAAIAKLEGLKQGGTQS
jgi:hypothetical protein